MSDQITVKKLTLLPCQPGLCPECGEDHKIEEPHNMNLYYQYHFHGVHNRFPTWIDAMAHCSDEVKKETLDVLRSHGIKV